MKHTTVTHTQRYVINGKEYNSLAEIPEAERKLLDQDFAQLLEDKDKDGIPDIVQNLRPAQGAESRVIRTVSTQHVDTSGAAKSGELLDKALPKLMESMLRDHRQSLPPRAPSQNVLPYVVIGALLAVIAFLLWERFQGG